MKRPKQQSPIVLFSKVGASATLASTFVMSSFVGVSTAFAANKNVLFEETIYQLQHDGSPLIAQAESTIVSFNTVDYAVRVFSREGQTLMNVYQQPNSEFPDGLLRLNEVPATFTIRNNRGVYISTGSYSGLNARYIVEVLSQDRARLIIEDSSNQPIEDPQEAAGTPVINVPPDVLDRARQSTILNFNTASYAVRVFERDGFQFMNVYNEFTGEQEVNGQPANLSPNGDAVRYVSSGQRGGQPVEYIAQLEGSGEASIIIQNVNGQQLFRDQATGPITINPQPGWAIDVNGDGEIDDTFVAAVFGDENTLAQVQAIYPTAFFDNSARQGRFINAGSFASQQAAQIRVLELQSEGFNSRLVFRDIRYR